MRPEYQQLDQLGQMPGDEVPSELIDRYVQVTDALPVPESADEIAVIVRTFPKFGQTFQGVAWTLLHCLEASPLWLATAVEYRQQAFGPEDEWMETLQRRIDKAGMDKARDE
ncbi:hypothetical protein [Deinococcus sp.]|uniref:hypothetical protein n=1 Tax=Deinococcus sp. TaxID=47478 RepID=UPI003CC5586B